MYLTLATFREELREAILQASRIKDSEYDISKQRVLLREEIPRLLSTWHSEMTKCNCSLSQDASEISIAPAANDKPSIDKEKQVQAWSADCSKSTSSLVESFRDKCSPTLPDRGECHLKDVGVHAASRQLAKEVTTQLDPPVVPLPGKLDEDGVCSAWAARSVSMDLEQIPSLDSWDANFPNVLRLPSDLRSSELSTANQKAAARRKSMINWRRNSGSGLVSRRSVSNTSRRRDSVDSQRSVESCHTVVSTVSSTSPAVCRANSEVSSVELPLAARRPSFLSTRLDLDKTYESLPAPSGVEWLVYHAYFDLTIAFLIILNGLSIGVQTDIMARAVTEKVPLALRVIEILFCIAFSMELGLRIMVEGRFFFIGIEWGWNLFDCCIVLLQVFEEIMEIVASFNSDEDGSRTNFSFMRMLRILRLIRIIRIVRVLRFIGELRTIVTSIASSMKHLLWTVMLLLLMIYTISVYLTQMVLDRRLGDSSADLSNLIKPWGSLGRSSLTLFASISGGIDWEIAVVPLVQHISVLLAPMFCLYIAFAILALMNVVTGVFVENAIDSANRDKERYLVQTVRELFEKADLDQSGFISWEEFESQLLNPELKTLLQALGIDQVSAKGLFKLLDIENSGFIGANELLTGTLRLRGEARSIDLAALIYENRRNSRRVHQALSKMHEQLASMSLCVRTSNRRD